MKPKTSLKIFAAGVALLGIVIFVIALLRSSEFNTIAGPKITQQSVASKLYHPVVQPNTTVTMKKPAPIASTPTAMPSATPSLVTPTSPRPTVAATAPPATPLTNTGPGNLVLLCIVCSAVGTTLAYAVNIKRLKLKID